MKVGELSDYLKQHWLTIREQLLSGTYTARVNEFETSVHGI
jgi:hypothetical protein